MHNDEERVRVTEQLERESQPVAEVALTGVALYADTLGGLEALAFECREKEIPVHEAGVGPVGRPTLLRIAAVKDPTHRAVLAFNVPILPDAQPEGEASPVRIFRGEVMYRILEEYAAWRTARLSELQAQRRLALIHPARLEVLAGFVFRVSKPAIVGVRVTGGTLRPGVRLMHRDGTEVGLLKALQKENESVQAAEENDELAASIDGAVMGRNLKEGDVLLVSLPESAARGLRGQTLTPRETEILDEVVRLHRATHPFWGQ